MDWKKIVGGLAPTVATALGGPLAGLATRAVSEALLGKPDGTDTEINAILRADPNKVLDLKIAEMSLTKELADNDIDLEEIHAADRQSARSRQVALKDKTPNYLAYMLTGMVALMVCGLIYLALSGAVMEEGIKTILISIVAAMTTVWIMSMKYFFGSSSGSKAKDETIANLEK